MRPIKTSLFLVLFIFSGWSQAQSSQGHYHGARISEEEAKSTAIAVINDHVRNEKLDSNWKEAEDISIAQRTYDGHLEWVVMFKNKTKVDPEMQTLYIFLTLGGELTGINYTGN